MTVTSHDPAECFAAHRSPLSFGFFWCRNWWNNGATIKSQKHRLYWYHYKCYHQTHTVVGYLLDVDPLLASESKMKWKWEAWNKSNGANTMKPLNRLTCITWVSFHSIWNLVFWLFINMFSKNILVGNQKETRTQKNSKRYYNIIPTRPVLLDCWLVTCPALWTSKNLKYSSATARLVTYNMLIRSCKSLMGFIAVTVTKVKGEREVLQDNMFFCQFPTATTTLHQLRWSDFQLDFDSMNEQHV